MDAVWAWFVKSIENGDYSMLLIAGAFVLAINIKKIADFWNQQKKVKVSNIKDALECESITGSTREFLQEALETEHFKNVTGVRAEKQIREAIIQAHKNTNGELSFWNFVKAAEFMEYKNSKLMIKIHWFEQLMHYATWGVVVFLFIMTMIYIILIALIPDKTWMDVFTLVGQGLVFFIFCLLMITQLWPIMAAKRVKKQLEKQS